MRRLEGRVAIVTGAASGIGKGIATEYAQQGAVVAILDINEAGAEAVRQEIIAAGGQALSFAADVTDYGRVRAVRDALLDQYGKIDILVNNAAFQILADVFDSTLEDWRRVIAVDLEAVYMAAKFVAEAMRTQQSGRIINIASIQAFMTSGNLGAYNAAKAGVVGLTHSLAVELAPYNILVNAIGPGFIKTAMSIMPDGTDETETAEFYEYYVGRRRIPLQRAGLPHDIAGTALFLASDDCRYLTGQLIVVDGGLSLTI
jgi:3-oxoacyl-[acyl-carrier protein] reductase